MRLANSRATDAYYAHTLSVLRLDKPRVVLEPDEEIRALGNDLIPEGRRAEISADPTITRLEDLTGQLGQAIKQANASEVARLRKAIAAAALAPAPAARPAGTQLSASPDVLKALEEALAFRTRVKVRPAAEVARAGDGASAILAPQVTRRMKDLGLSRVSLVDDLPIIVAAFGYTRRSLYQPTYDEEVLNARDLPTQLRPFYALDRRAALRLDRIDVEGNVPLLAREGEHEGIFLGLDRHRVLEWLARNGVSLDQGGEPEIGRILSRLEPVDRYYDKIWTLPVRRLVFGLVHSLSRDEVIGPLAGLERTSLGEYVMLPLLGTVIYANGGMMKMGCMETVVRDNLDALLDDLGTRSLDCLYDPDCLDRVGACHGCLHSPEISCRTFNHGLSRAFLRGGRSPWRDAAMEEDIFGYWQ